MSLSLLEVRDFRCIEDARLELDSRCTVISGANGSGKTSLLEAINTLSCGHSFRTSKRDVLIRTAQNRFEIVGTIKTSRNETIGLAGQRDVLEARVNGQSVRGFSQQANLLPVRVIDPEVHQLIEGGPSERRRFIDWGAFHVEPAFAVAWRRYQKGLRQRNAALKAKLSRASVATWDRELGATAEILTQCRESYLAGLQEHVVAAAENLNAGTISLSYQQGWSKSEPLVEVLTRTFELDARYGATTAGPHRADIEIKVNENQARDRVSRGQQKAVAAALLLAQINYWQLARETSACLLLDDPAAELDVDNFQNLLLAVQKMRCQLIITALDPEPILATIGGARFHVEQGKVRTVL